MVPVCTAFVLGSALLSVHLAAGSALPAKYFNQSYTGLNDGASLLAPRMDNDGTMAAGVSDPLDGPALDKLKNEGQRLLEEMQGAAVEQEQRRAAGREIHSSGWSQYVESPPSPMPDLRHLQNAIGVEGFSGSGGYFGMGTKGANQNGVTLNPRNWKSVRQVQDKPYSTNDGSKHQATDAKYDGDYSFAEGIMVVRDFDTPWPQDLVGQGGQWPMITNGRPAPAVRDFSDLALIAYFASFDKRIPIQGDLDKRPPMFIELQFQNIPDVTRRAVVACLVYYGISDLPGGDGLTFPIGTFGHQVLLGTNPIGFMANFLIQHKWKLGNAVIGAITVRDTGHTQREGGVEHKVPFFTLYVQRDTQLLSTAEDKNKAFEKERQRPFVPWQPRGPLSSKKGPLWPYPMQVARKGNIFPPASGVSGQSSDATMSSGSNAPESGLQSHQNSGQSAPAPLGARPMSQGQTASSGAQMSGKGKQRAQGLTWPARGQLGSSNAQASGEGKQRTQELTWPARGQLGLSNAQASGKGKQRVQDSPGLPAQGQSGGSQFQYEKLPQWQYQQQGGPTNPGAAQPRAVAPPAVNFTPGEQQRAREAFIRLRRDGVGASDAVDQMVAAWMRNYPDKFSSQLQAEYQLRLMLGISQTVETKKYHLGN